MQVHLLQWSSFITTSFKMHWNLLIVIVSFFSVINVGENETLHRKKRAYFLYPMGGQFKIVFAVAVPVKLGSKQTMAFALNMQFQYAVATNISQIKEYPPTVSRLKEKRELVRSDRAFAYLGLEAIMERYGFNGRSCLLRTICENAMNSLYHEGNGLYGHILHVLLTPNYGDYEVDTDLNPLYFEAQKGGEYGVDCISLYPDCPYGHGILEMISFLNF